MFFSGERPCSPSSITYRAKSHYRHYSVVGLLEEFADFWSMLEQALPQYFSGAFQTYISMKKSGKDKLNKGHYKSKPNPITLEIMKERLALDLEFYGWVKKNVYENMAKLKSSMSTM